MSLTPVEVTMINGEQSTWCISTKLGDAHSLPTLRPHADAESIGLLSDDLRLQASLKSMLLSEVSNNATVARKDGVFGVLYYRHFDCAESDLASRKTAANRGRVIRRIQADISSEISLNPRFPEEIGIAIPPTSPDSYNQVALWIFVPHTIVSEDGNWDALDDVIALLME